MIWIEKLKVAFGIDVLAPKKNDYFVWAMKRIVASHSHGNVRLTQAKYYTEKDVDSQFERLKGNSFSEL